MKPLSPLNYLLNNIKHILPNFICIIFSVFLIYFSSLLLSSNIYIMNLNILNLYEKVTIVTTNSNSPISDKIINTIQNDNDIRDVIPIISINGFLEYNNAFSGSDFNCYNIFKKDIPKLLNTLQLKVVYGKLPTSNKNEILLPLKYAKQLKINVGQNIVSNFDNNIMIDKKYNVCGIIDGPVNIALTSNENSISREIALKHNIMFSVKNNSTKLNSRIMSLGNNNIIISDYAHANSEIHDYIKSIDFLIYIFDIVIILVLTISLNNLNYIIFTHRKKEFAILYAIGYSQNEIYKKLLKENVIINFLGFIIGIIFTIIITELLNITLWIPKGQFVNSFSLHYILITFLVPLFVSLANMLSYFQEIKYMNYSNISI